MNEIIVTPKAELRLLHEGIEINDCLEWSGLTTEDGYGRISINGKTQRVHRVAWVMYYGTQPKNLICHHCDNPPCYKKEHLYNGTYSLNLIDAHARNKRPRSQLIKNTYRKIFLLYLTNYSVKDLAIKFNISQRQVQYIIREGLEKLNDTFKREPTLCN